MDKTIATIILTVALCVPSVSAADPRMVAQAPATSTAPATPAEKTPAGETKPGAGQMAAVEVRGSVASVDRNAGTVTLKGPKGRTLTLEVRDKQKLDAIKAGDPVVATYVEALMFRVQPTGKEGPDAKVEERMVTSKPGETPAGAVGRQITAVVTITAIDKAAGTVTVKGPRGRTETIKAQDRKNLEAVKVGDRVEITYSQALAIALDKQEKPDKAAK